MRLDINLASSPYQDLRSFWLRWGGGLAVAALITIVLAYTALAGWAAAAKDRDLIHQVQQQIDSRDHERQNAEALLSRRENISIRDRSQFLNDLFERKAFSWTRVFEDMERVMPARLHVVSIHPDMSAEHELELKLVVAGESRDRALELVRNMEDSQHFQQTEIVEENVAAQQTPGDNVQFNIIALYVPSSEVALKRSAK
jgi:type IV pilus assembly protein PilN